MEENITRTLVIGDIHGGFRALQHVLEKAKVTTLDTLIFLGDYVDGWSQAPEVLSFLIKLNKTHQCIFIRGNHDALFLEWLDEKKENEQWFEHGGEATVKAYKNVDTVTIKAHILFLKNLKNYYLDEQNRLFIHAGFTNLNGINSEFFSKMFYWDRSLWETALALDDRIQPTDLYYPKRLSLYKEIYIGHTPTTRINQIIPINKGNVWNIDTGAAFTGPLTILDIDTKDFWQSEPLPYLYPDEKGRN